MKLKVSDLEQLTPERVQQLSVVEQVRLLNTALEDLREAHDRLNRTPWNSSCPPSSQGVWARTERPESEGEDAEAEQKGSEEPAGVHPEVSASGDGTGEQVEASQGRGSDAAGVGVEAQRKPGRQLGMTGHSRSATLPVTGTVKQVVSACVVCGAELTAEHFVAEQGHWTVDVERLQQDGEWLGLRATYVKHLYGTTTCSVCGHGNRSEPGRAPAEVQWEVELTEWHLVGPLLVSLIVFLSLRMRLSRARVQEFLQQWLGIVLSTSTINHCVHEAGRAVEPLEDELVVELQAAALVHVDETPWKEGREVLWLWCFVTVSTCLYLIGYRNKEFLEIVLGERFAGWLMSDGYWAYRLFAKRLRCWAHLVRKARGLAQSSNALEAQPFGQAVLALLAELMAAIYAARAGPGEADLKQRFAERLAVFKRLCEPYAQANHPKTRALAREFLNDWEAIWAILADPQLPLTNNTAERALRHWVIARLLSQGTRTPQGTRAFGLLASIIDTCRLRQRNPWSYLAEVIAKRRRGEQPPPMPAPALS